MNYCAHIVLVLNLVSVLFANGYYGTGADGDTTVNNYDTDYLKTIVVGNNPAGEMSLQVANTTGFHIGDEILIISMQDPTTAVLEYNSTGNYEFHIISNIEDNTIEFNDSLEHSYDSEYDIKHPSY